MSHLTAEWREWAAENLARGVPRPLLLGALRQAGLPRARAAAELRSLARHPAVAAARRLCRTHASVLSLMDTRSALFRELGERRLEKRALAPREFIEDYYLAHRPVVLQGLTAGWPALERWKPERLAERFADVEVEVMLGREADPEHDVDPTAHRRAMRMADFIRLVLQTSPSNDCYLTARNEALERTGLQRLLEDVPVPRGYVRPWERPSELRLWIGPAGTLTAMHHDLNSLLSVQVVGRKHFWLVPSYELHRMANRRGVWSEIDGDGPDLERHPAYRDANAVQTTLETGEALFLPMGFCHQVRALEVSVSLTFDRFDVDGENTSWLMP